MRIVPKFPKHRFHDPKRQAELAVYRELEASTTPGVALYEPRFGPYSRGLDFAAWFEGIGRFGIETKGGQHSVKDATWYLSTPSGQVEIDCPALQAWDGSHGHAGPHCAEEGQRPVRHRRPGLSGHGTGRQHVREALADSPVHAIFGVEDLTGQLSEAGPRRSSSVRRTTSCARWPWSQARSRSRSRRPTPRCCRSRRPTPRCCRCRTCALSHLVIHHVEHLHIHTPLPAAPEGMAP